jgi:hypothetical protein
MSEAGRRYQHQIEGARFEKFKDFKVTWNRTGREKSYKVSDYISDSPDEVLYDFLDTLISRNSGNNKEYGPEYLEWVSSDGFVLSRRPVYLERSRNITMGTEGRSRDIGESLDRLLESGLLTDSDIDNSFFTWTSAPCFTKVGSCSPMFRVVTISSSLDSDKVPENVLDFVVYHESLHLRRGYRPNRRAHDRTFRDSEHAFPGWKECEKHLLEMKRKQKGKEQK